MVNLAKLYKFYCIERNCYKCGKVMHLTDFIAPLLHQQFFLLKKVKAFKKLGIELLAEIWGNPIFVINCCKCHNREERRRIREEKNYAFRE